MSFANKGRDSEDTKKLRAEYQAIAIRKRDAKNTGERIKLGEDSTKAFARVVESISHERSNEVKKKQKVLADLGMFKTPAQMSQARQALNSERNERIAREGR